MVPFCSKCHGRYSTVVSNSILNFDDGGILVQKIEQCCGKMAFLVDDIFKLDKIFKQFEVRAISNKVASIVEQLSNHGLFVFGVEGNKNKDAIVRVKLRYLIKRLLSLEKEEHKRKTLFHVMLSEWKNVPIGKLLKWSYQHNEKTDLSLVTKVRTWERRQQEILGEAAFKRLVENQVKDKRANDDNRVPLEPIYEGVDEVTLDDDNDDDSDASNENSDNDDNDDDDDDDDYIDTEEDDTDEDSNIRTRSDGLSPDERWLQIPLLMLGGRNSSMDYNVDTIGDVIEQLGGQRLRKLCLSSVNTHKWCGGLLTTMQLATSLKNSKGAVLQTDCGTVKKHLAVSLCFQVLDQDGNLVHFKNFARSIQGKKAEIMVKSIDHFFGELALADFFCVNSEKVLLERLELFKKDRSAFDEELLKGVKDMKDMIRVFLGDKMEQASIRAAFGKKLVLVHCGAHKLDLFINDIFTSMIGMDPSASSESKSYSLMKLLSKTFSSAFAYISEKSLSWGYFYWYYAKTGSLPHIPMISISRWGSCLRNVVCILKHLDFMLEFLKKFCTKGLVERKKIIEKLAVDQRTIGELLFFEALERRFHSRFIKAISIVNRTDITIFRLWRAFCLYWIGIAKINPSFEEWLGLNPDGSIAESDKGLDFQFDKLDDTSEKPDDIVGKYFNKLEDTIQMNDFCKKIWPHLAEKARSRTKDVFNSSLSIVMKKEDFEGLLHVENVDGTINGEPQNWSRLKIPEGEVEVNVKDENGNDYPVWFDIQALRETFLDGLDGTDAEKAIICEVIEELLKRMVMTNHSCEHTFAELGKWLYCAPHSSKIFIMGQAAFMSNRTSKFMETVPLAVRKHILKILECYRNFVGNYGLERLMESQYKFSILDAKLKKKIDSALKYDPLNEILDAQDFDGHIKRNNQMKRIKKLEDGMQLFTFKSVDEVNDFVDGAIKDASSFKTAKHNRIISSANEILRNHLRKVTLLSNSPIRILDVNKLDLKLESKLRGEIVLERLKDRVIKTIEAGLFNQQADGQASLMIQYDNYANKEHFKIASDISLIPFKDGTNLLCCPCGNVVDGELVSCDGCCQWWHTSCCSYNSKSKKNDLWFCLECSKVLKERKNSASTDVEDKESSESFTPEPDANSQDMEVDHNDTTSNESKIDSDDLESGTMEIPAHKFTCAFCNVTYEDESSLRRLMGRPGILQCNSCKKKRLRHVVSNPTVSPAHKRHKPDSTNQNTNQDNHLHATATKEGVREELSGSELINCTRCNDLFPIQDGNDGICQKCNETN
eukprot:TRINITY_DN549_c0_g1_i8.p1 TRINITY_DN549_c0_g1~~TRINITY_DN549_c0_g1_i8.p1  ORF type:complete len:1279 (-),score=312.49 TRINITY_DN549_c0_g1_i8:964-4800(-)